MTRVKLVPNTRVEVVSPKEKCNRVVEANFACEIDVSGTVRVIKGKLILNKKEYGEGEEVRV